MCSPVKGSASNDKSTAVVQKQTNPARMKNQWALRNSDNEKVPLPVRSNGEAPLAEQPSAFSCSPRPVPPPRLLSPSSTQGHSQWSKQAQNLGGKKKNKRGGVTQKGARNQLLKPSLSQARPGFGRQGKNSLVHKIPPVPGEGMNPWAWGTSHGEKWLFTHTQIKYCYKFFCKAIPHSSLWQPMSNKCDFPECSWINLGVKDKFGLLITVADLSPLITLQSFQPG